MTVSGSLLVGTCGVPYTPLISQNQCPKGQSVFVERDGHELAVFHLDSGEIIVTDNACPHAGANLAGGPLVGSVVTCPWHDWEFDLVKGACVHSEQAKIVRYPVQVRDEQILADLSNPY